MPLVFRVNAVSGEPTAQAVAPLADHSHRLDDHLSTGKVPILADKTGESACRWHLEVVNLPLLVLVTECQSHSSFPENVSFRSLASSSPPVATIGPKPSLFRARSLAFPSTPDC